MPEAESPTPEEQATNNKTSEKEEKTSSNEVQNLLLKDVEVTEENRKHIATAIESVRRELNTLLSTLTSQERLSLKNKSQYYSLVRSSDGNSGGMRTDHQIEVDLPESIQNESVEDIEKHRLHVLSLASNLMNDTRVELNDQQKKKLESATTVNNITPNSSDTDTQISPQAQKTNPPPLPKSSDTKVARDPEVPKPLLPKKKLSFWQKATFPIVHPIKTLWGTTYPLRHPKKSGKWLWESGKKANSWFDAHFTDAKWLNTFNIFSEHFFLRSKK